MGICQPGSFNRGDNLAIGCNIKISGDDPATRSRSAIFIFSQKLLCLARAHLRVPWCTRRVPREVRINDAKKAAVTSEKCAQSDVARIWRNPSTIRVCDHMRVE